MRCLSQIDMQPLESFTFKGANNDDVQGFLVKPPGFDACEKISAEIPDPRRTARRVGRFVDAIAGTHNSSPPTATSW